MENSVGNNQDDTVSTSGNDAKYEEMQDAIIPVQELTMEAIKGIKLLEKQTMETTEAITILRKRTMDTMEVIPLSDEQVIEITEAIISLDRLMLETLEAYSRLSKKLTMETENNVEAITLIHDQTMETIEKASNNIDPSGNN